MNCCGVSFQDGEEGCWSHVSTFVINLAAAVNIAAVGLVVQLTLEGILAAVGDVVVGEGDDVVGGVAVLEEDLISMANVGLVPVIPKSI